MSIEYVYLFMIYFCGEWRVGTIIHNTCSHIYDIGETSDACIVCVLKLNVSMFY